jgi:bifunctional DNA-binding transcriptional regulator/antitoxin component of YhaV-PrlF toxin-antitoxin module
MSLSESVDFKAVLQKGNRIQIPKLIRWQYHLEPSQVLKVEVKTGAWREEEFYARMGRDGRLTIPKLTLELLQQEDESLVSSVLEVTLEPATSSG